MTFNRSSQKKSSLIDYTRSLSSASFKATTGWIHWTWYVLVFASLCGTYLELIYLFAAVTRRPMYAWCTALESPASAPNIFTSMPRIPWIWTWVQTHDSYYQWISLKLSRMLMFIDLRCLNLSCTERDNDGEQPVHRSFWLDSHE